MGTDSLSSINGPEIAAALAVLGVLIFWLSRRWFKGKDHYVIEDSPTTRGAIGIREDWGFGWTDEKAPPRYAAEEDVYEPRGEPPFDWQNDARTCGADYFRSD